MKRQLICIPFFFFFGCTIKQDNLSIESLPYKEAGINLLDSNTHQIKWGEMVLQIKYKSIDENRFVYEDSPFLFSIGPQGKTIDSLKLFRHKPYSGTDSYYLPWLEIDQSGIIITTDTSVYDAYKVPENNSEKFIVQHMRRDTAIRVTKFKVDKLGKFTKIQ